MVLCFALLRLIFLHSIPLLIVHLRTVYNCINKFTPIQSLSQYKLFIQLKENVGIKKGCL
ncbi:hypothetical protein J6TS2_35720 [Heyndrickxia sporothermodurans]|nr:hypothetical protein J6TS2_35720 [Heyndrickxia sporothermodurans]